MEHIKRAGVLSIVPENAEVIVRSEGVQQLATVLQNVSTAKALPLQVPWMPVRALLLRYCQCAG